MESFGSILIMDVVYNHEVFHTSWKQLIAKLERVDEMVLSKLYNVVRGYREFSAIIEYRRIKIVHIIYINDRIDLKGELFPKRTVSQILEVFGCLPKEVVALRKPNARKKKY